MAGAGAKFDTATGSPFALECWRTSRVARVCYRPARTASLQKEIHIPYCRHSPLHRPGPMAIASDTSPPLPAGASVGILYLCLIAHRAFRLASPLTNRRPAAHHLETA